MGDSGWLVVGVDPTAEWSNCETTWAFDGEELIMRPPAKVSGGATLPDISVGLRPDCDLDAALGIVRRFLSALSWRSRRSVEERGYLVATGRMRHGGHTRYLMLYGDPEYHWPRSSPPESRQQLAQALYREALTINSIPYEFLGLFKILEVAASTGNGRKALIRKAAKEIAGSTSSSWTWKDAAKRLDELITEGDTAEDWLYESCRCAIAHANHNPVMNPDDVSDTRRLRKDASLMRAVAEFVMIRDLGL